MMTRKIKFNINWQVRIVLRERGKDILLRHSAEFARGARYEDPAQYLDCLFPGWRKGRIRMQLWEVMNIFGPFMRVGESPVETEFVMEVDL